MARPSHAQESRRRRHARLTKRLPERLGRVNVDVHAHEVNERAGADRPVGAEAHRPVEILGTDARLVEDAHAVVQERDEDAVDDEPRRVVAADRLLADAARELDGVLHGLLRGGGGAGELDEGGGGGRGGGGAGGAGRGGSDRGHGKRGGVRGEDRVGADESVELAKEQALRLQLLDDRLDHEVAAGEVAELRRRREPRKRRGLLLRAEPPLVDAAREIAVDPGPGPLAELRAHLAPDDVEPGLDADLRDPGAHGPEPDDTDDTYLHVRDPTAAPTEKPPLKPRSKARLTPFWPSDFVTAAEAR